MANPEVTIATPSKAVRAKAKVISGALDLPTKERIATHRIGWRSPHCPTFEPATETFVEFLPEGPPEALFDEASITHSPADDPLPAASFREVKEWERKGNFYQPRPR